LKKLKGEGRMSRKIVGIIVAITLSLLLSVPAAVYASPPIKNPNEIIIGSIGMPETVDPAWCYDSASMELLLNVYDTLVRFDGERVDTFIPNLATEWTIEDINETSPEGLTWVKRYTFRIRLTNLTGNGPIYFHDESYTLSTEDVEYSFERWMVQDRDGGPQWMIYEPLLGVSGVYDLWDLGYDNVTIGKMIDHAVESNDTHVWFNLVMPYPPFLQVISQPWAGILSKQWINDYVIGTLGRHEWNGEWGDYTGWVDYHNPDTSPLDEEPKVMCGTGPYMGVPFSGAEYESDHWTIVRFEDFWGGWPLFYPAPWYPTSPSGFPPAAYVDKITMKDIPDTDTRLNLFKGGDIDFCYVPSERYAEFEDYPGIRYWKDLPELMCVGLFFTFNVSLTSPYGTILDPGTFDETGYPCDFFSDINVRKAFATLFNYEKFISEVLAGEAIQPPTAIIPGLPCYDPSIPKYTYDLVQASKYFKAAWGGQLWNTGFTIPVLYNTGNLARQRAAEYIQDALDDINAMNGTKFHAEVMAVDWPTYLGAMVSMQLPTFIIGWGADYPDPHNFAFPFYHSRGTFAAWQGYKNDEMDSLIEQGIRAPQEERCPIYHDIQVLAHEDCPSTILYQPIGRHYERDWIVGWYYNPVLAPAFHYGTIWKGYYVPGCFETDYVPGGTTVYDINYERKG